MQPVLSAFGFMYSGHVIQLRLSLDGNSNSGHWKHVPSDLIISSLLQSGVMQLILSEARV